MNTEELNKFYKRASFAGLMSIYTMKLSMDYNTAFDLNDYSMKNPLGSSDYFYGFIVACASFGIIGYNSKGKVITVTFVDQLINETVESQVKKMAEQNENWSKYIENAKKYFQDN